ncbi:MAG: DUF4340 domain-containing protein [Gemmataceae bacterium]|nr:DUF4340 domain-containing protein [Gemmataceae bacterium]
MNLRSTAWLFAVMFSMLWLFGLMLAFKKNPLDRSYVVPTLQAARDLDVVSVTIERRPPGKDPQEFQFTQDNDVWRLKDASSNLAVKVESFRINNIVSQVKNARKDEEADVSNDLARHGLDAPQATITIRGRDRTRPASLTDDDKDKKDEKKDSPKEKVWKLHLGKESADKKYVFANSSDEPNRVFAVAKSSVDSLFFDDPNHLRSKGIFDFSDATAKSVEIKQGAAELELTKGDDNLWRFVKPSLGYADVEGPAPPKDLPPEIKLPKTGVKGLLEAIRAIRVDADGDFVAMHKDNLTKFQLEDGKEALRIQVGTPDGKKDSKETVLVGVQERGYYYARLGNDEGVFKLQAKVIDPVVDALKNPGRLRSLDVGHFDPKTIDAVTLTIGAEETKLWKPEGKPWQIQIGTDKPKKANEKAVQTLLDTLQGKRQIQRFHDVAGDAVKKLDAELGLDAPKAVVTLYANGLEKKDEVKEKKDEKKDEKKEDKKDEKKDTKTEDGFNLKKDATPALTLHFGKADKDTVAVLRLKDDRFVVAKSMLDAAAPAEGALAFLDPALPSFDAFDVAHLELQRGAKKIELEKATGAQAGRWLVKEGADQADHNLADVLRTDHLFRALGSLTAKKWVKRLDAKEDLEKYGLKAPVLTATVNVKKQQLTPAGAASALAMLGLPGEARLFAAVNAVVANMQASKGETIVVQFGAETADKDVYAKHSGSDLLFTVPAGLLKALREIDLRDKTALVAFEPALAAGIVGAPAGQSLAGVNALAPASTGQVTGLDPARIKEVRVAVRTSYELREFAFQRKDKTWTDASGLKDFNLDADKVEELVKDFGRLRAERFISLAGGPKTDHKLAAKDFLVKIDLTTDDGKAATITMGAPFERGHFAHSSNWREAVFLVNLSKVEPLLRGVGFFAKERAVAE